MTRAEDTCKLGEDMIASYDIRISAIGDIIAETRKILSDFHEERKERENKVREMLKRFQQEEKEMVAQLNKFLAESESTRIENSRKMEAERKREVSKMLDDFRREREETAAQWQKLLSTMEKKRGSKKG